MKFLTLITAAVLSLALPLAGAADKKPAPKKTSTKASTRAKAKKPISRKAAKAVELVTPVARADERPLSEGELSIAKLVYTGNIQCELGADVTVTPDVQKPGYFNVSTKGVGYRMHPVESRTGAIRLEDAEAGALWLQIANKSMLMNQREGQRLADECMAPAQVAFAGEMKKNPPKALFEGADAPKK